VAQGTVRAYEMAQKYGIKTGWGTDILFSPRARPPGQAAGQADALYDPMTLLKQATGTNGELLALSASATPTPAAGPHRPGALPIFWWPMATRR
jgi:imidazolonepropionase-like amidohydrolase